MSAPHRSEETRSAEEEGAPESRPPDEVPAPAWAKVALAVFPFLLGAAVFVVLRVLRG